jgi:hypothetical protein
MRGAPRNLGRGLGLSLLVWLLAGCGPPRAPAGAPASQTGAAPARSPYGGWWVALTRSAGSDPAKGAEGYRITTTELVAILPPNPVERRAIHCEQKSPARWACATGKMPFGIAIEGATLVLDAPDGLVRARPAIDAETRAFEEQVAATPELSAACAKAKECYLAACPIRGLAECSFEGETDGSSLRQCEGTRAGVVLQLQELGQPVPPACQ